MYLPLCIWHIYLHISAYLCIFWAYCAHILHFSHLHLCANFLLIWFCLFRAYLCIFSFASNGQAYLPLCIFNFFSAYLHSLCLPRPGRPISSINIQTAAGAQRECFFRLVLLPLVLHGFAWSFFRLWEFGATAWRCNVVQQLYNIVYYRPGVMYVLLNVIKAEVCSSFTSITTTVREQHPRPHHKGTIGGVRTGLVWLPTVSSSVIAKLDNLKTSLSLHSFRQKPKTMKTSR